jgi:hypothetical protein
MVANLTKDTTPVRPQPLAPEIVRPVLPPSSNNGRSSIQSEEAISDTIPYLGESSFEVHSQQTSQVLEKALESIPSSRFHSNGGLSAWQSIREILKEKTSHPPKSFTHKLPMVPIQTALKTLRLIDGMYQITSAI